MLLIIIFKRKTLISTLQWAVVFFYLPDYCAIVKPWHYLIKISPWSQTHIFSSFPALMVLQSSFLLFPTRGLLPACPSPQCSVFPCESYMNVSSTSPQRHSQMGSMDTNIQPPPLISSFYLSFRLLKVILSLNFLFLAVRCCSYSISYCAGDICPFSSLRP